MAVFGTLIVLLASRASTAETVPSVPPAQTAAVADHPTDRWLYGVAERDDSEIPPRTPLRDTSDVTIAEPWFGDVPADKVALAASVLDLSRPVHLTTEDATALLEEASAVLATGSIAGPLVRSQVRSLLASLQPTGPPVDTTIDLAGVRAATRSELELLAAHHGVTLPTSQVDLPRAAAELADAAGIPDDGLPVHVRVAMAQQRRMVDLFAQEMAARLGVERVDIGMQSTADGHVLTAHVSMVGPDGPVRLWLVGLHPADPSTDLQVVAPGELRTVPEHGRTVDDAVAVVNGGFWTRTADPDGLTVVDGRLLSDTSSGKTWVRNARPALGMDDQLLHVGLPSWTLAIGSREGAPLRPVRGFERAVNGPADLVASVGAPAPAPPGTGAIAFDLAPGDLLQTSQAMRPLADLAVPPADGLVRVFVTGNNTWPHLTAEEAWVRIEVGGGFDGLPEVLAGGPSLLRAGAATDVHTWRQEGFGPAHTDLRHPRTFGGVDRWGNALFIVADGRRPGWSIGLTQGESAEVAAALGVVDAIQFDGGGSSTYVQDGRVHNRPSDGVARVVATALAITWTGAEG